MFLIATVHCLVDCVLGISHILSNALDNALEKRERSEFGATFNCNFLIHQESQEKSNRDPEALSVVGFLKMNSSSLVACVQYTWISSNYLHRFATEI